MFEASSGNRLIEKDIGMDGWPNRSALFYIANGYLCCKKELMYEVLDIEPNGYPHVQYNIYSLSGLKETTGFKAETAHQTMIAGKYVYSIYDGITATSLETGKAVKNYGDYYGDYICGNGDKIFFYDTKGFLNCMTSGIGIVFDKEFYDFGTVSPKSSPAIEVGIENVGSLNVKSQLSVDMPYAWLPVKTIDLAPRKPNRIRINLNLANYKGELSKALSGSLIVRSMNRDFKIPVRAFIGYPKTKISCEETIGLPPWEELGRFDDSCLNLGRMKTGLELEKAYFTKDRIVSFRDGHIDHYSVTNLEKTKTIKTTAEKVRLAITDHKGFAYIIHRGKPQITKVDELTGKVLWTHSTGSGTEAFNRIYFYQDKIYVTMLWLILCIDAGTGKKLWSLAHKIPKDVDYFTWFDYINCVAFNDGMLYAPILDQCSRPAFTLYCIDAKSGKIKWKSAQRQDSLGYMSLLKPSDGGRHHLIHRIVAMHNRIVVYYTGGLYCFSQTTGELKFASGLWLDGDCIENGLLKGTKAGKSSLYGVEIDTGKEYRIGSESAFCRFGDVNLNVVGYSGEFIRFTQAKTGKLLSQEHVKFGHLEKDLLHSRSLNGMLFVGISDFNGIGSTYQMDENPYHLRFGGLVVLTKAVTTLVMQVDSNSALADEVKAETSPPKIVNGKVYIPMKAVLRFFGGDIVFAEGSKVWFDVSFDNVRINAKIGHADFDVNGQDKKFDPNDQNVKPFMSGDEIMMPMEATCRELGIKCSYDPKTRKIKFTS
jgi:hypothetical protein